MYIIILALIASIEFTAPRSNNIDGVAISTPTNQIQPGIVGTFRETLYLSPPQLEVLRVRPAPADNMPNRPKYLILALQKALIRCQWQPG